MALRDRQGKADFRFRSIEEFVAHEAVSGRIEIHYRGLPIDLFIRDMNAPSTLVVFHAAVPVAYDRLPVFSGQALQEELGVNLVSVADPSLVMGPNVHLGWYIGNRWQGPLRRPLSQILKHCLATLGTRRTVLFGPSGGAFAASQFALDIPGSIAFLVNPRIDLGAKPDPASRVYLTECHKAESKTPRDRIWRNVMPEAFDQAHRDSSNERLYLIYQNYGDTAYREGQFRPLVERNLETPGIRFRIGNDGEGHLPIPRTILMETLNWAFLSSPVDAIDWRSIDYLLPKDALNRLKLYKIES